MKLRYPLMVAILVASVAVAFTAHADDPDPFDAPLPTVEGRVSDKAIAIMSGATRVEAFKITRRPRQIEGQLPTTVPAENIHGYPIVSVGTEQGKDYVARFTKVALDGNTYIRAVAMCFEPGVALRFWRGKESVDVLVCFHCNNVLITTTDTEDGTLISFHNARGKPALKKLVDECFPQEAKDKKPTP